MIKVYFEDAKLISADLVAVFDDEELFDRCLPALEAEAKASGCTLTESIDEEPLRLLK